MSLTKDDVKVGYCLAHQTEGENLYVYKVNEKSFYAGVKTAEEVEEIKAEDASNKELPHLTFSGLMEVVGGKSYNYDGFRFAKPEQAVEVSEEEEKLFIYPQVKKLLKRLYSIKERGVGPWSNMNMVGKEFVVLLDANEEGKCVVKIDNRTLFYHLETEKQKMFNFEKDKHGGEIIWENFQIN